jgi:hypothetical protein
MPLWRLPYFQRKYNCCTVTTSLMGEVCIVIYPQYELITCWKVLNTSHAFIKFQKKSPILVLTDIKESLYLNHTLSCNHVITTFIARFYIKVTEQTDWGCCWIVFWDVTLQNQTFWRNYCLHLQGWSISQTRKLDDYAWWIWKDVTCFKIPFLQHNISFMPKIRLPFTYS